MGGLNRPPTIQEAAEISAPLARDFIFLLNRMRQLAESEKQFEQSLSSQFIEPKLTWG